MTTVKYLRRKNLGNYEHEEFEIVLPVESVEKEIVYYHGLEVKQLVLSLLQDNKKVEEKAVVEKAVEKAVVKAKKEEVAVVEVVVPALKEEVQVEMELPLEEKKEEVVAAVKEKKEKKEAKTKAAKASKATMYDRELDTHKSLIGRWLDTEFKQWLDSTNLPKFGKASRTLSGNTEFLDENGDILESFKEKFRELVLA